MARKLVPLGQVLGPPGFDVVPASRESRTGKGASLCGSCDHPQPQRSLHFVRSAARRSRFALTDRGIDTAAIDRVEFPEQCNKAFLAHPPDDQAIPLLAQDGCIVFQLEFARNAHGLVSAVVEQPHVAFGFIPDGDSKASVKASVPRPRSRLGCDRHAWRDRGQCRHLG